MSNGCWITRRVHPSVHVQYEGDCLIQGGHAIVSAREGNSETFQHTNDVHAFDDWFVIA